MYCQRNEAREHYEQLKDFIVDGCLYTAEKNVDKHNARRDEDAFAKA